ncbi:MAG: fructose-bisphosphatase class II family protein [Candidatus Marinimicrobia bacterium]|nr:fructose-bisphosphatase class II family protein [Candidatus Neomarinimicrobiota bacterium]MCF7829403.1 fructose-bisphosphatase class II family protein [Candidatus Neomarinimicrobiota bacterium]MCF7880889.1 fructose-bisphosphatase class II family protein [Candidatus Neomarinimicrobiota bacterium]
MEEPPKKPTEENLKKATTDIELPHNLGFDLVRCTEAAAIAAGRWMGKGNLEDADQGASESMQELLNTLQIRGNIDIGEEVKPEMHTPMESGGTVGTGEGPEVDLVVDPIDGRQLLAEGRQGVISAIGAAPKGGMRSPAPAIYMEKLVVSREVADALVEECMNAPVAWTLGLIARIKEKKVEDLVVFVLDRPRHKTVIQDIRNAGARAMLRHDGDIAGALMAATPGGPVDILMGVGGVPQGMMTACAIKALGGKMLGRLAPQTEEERGDIDNAELSSQEILTSDDLVTSKDVYFAATGITDGPLMEGVQYHGNRIKTHSVILRSTTGSRRDIYTERQIES